MKRKQLMKVQRSLSQAACAVLAVLTICLTMAQAQAQRGRVSDPAARINKQSATVLAETTITLDQEAVEALAQIEQQSNNQFLQTRTLRFDVSENAKRFIFDETPLHPDGLPAYGNEFVTEGYIYPAGTLNATNGVKPDGSPEFPNRVIGRWTCRGWHVGEGAKTVTGPWVVTHQLYDFGPEAGRLTLVTDGVELVDIDKPVLRAVSGGTGPYAQARGEARQTMIGFNQLNGVNLRLEVRINTR
jgi:hypothetical protein